MNLIKNAKENNIIFLNTKFLLILFSLFMLGFIAKERECSNIKHICHDYNRIVSKNMSISNLNTTAKNVMFVAHPDDETLWGSATLYDEKYLVVCITCGGRPDRVAEFEKVMSLTEDDYIMLNYPDLVKGVKSDWQKDWNDINSDIKDIIDIKDWDLVVTHNPDGEYGHIHHKMTNHIVTKYANHDKLAYFGHFYWGVIPNENEMDQLDAYHYEFKIDVLLPVYKTQKNVINDFKRMIQYESLITYNEWYGD